VVDMLLTGFDSKYLNTLYVDKKLKYHGLIQAFSRTNRILNDSKPYGNILDFRQQAIQFLSSQANKGSKRKKRSAEKHQSGHFQEPAKHRQAINNSLVAFD